jgi:catechol-2,3-dioxygenase
MIQLGSVNLTVQDISASEQFYVEVLGLVIDAERSHRPSFVLLRAANCMIILQDAQSIGQSPKIGNAVELAFEVDDLGAMQQKLGNRAAVQQMGWGNAIETTDPDGNRLNLYRWR